MPEPIDRTYFADRAAQARKMASQAATPAARHIHLELAADYDRHSIERKMPPVGP